MKKSNILVLANVGLLVFIFNNDNVYNDLIALGLQFGCLFGQFYYAKRGE